MTEKDLKEYLIRKKDHDQAEEALRDFEAAIYGASGQKLTGMPTEKKFPEDKMALIANRHAELRQTEKASKEAMDLAEANLMLAMSFLGGDERAFFVKRYIEGKQYDTIMREMHISRPTSCRLRCHILDTVKPL